MADVSSQRRVQDGARVVAAWNKVVEPPALNYLKRDPVYEVEKPYMTTFDTTELGGPETNYRFAKYNINAQNAAEIQGEFNLDTNGFQLLQRATHLEPSDFDCEEAIVSRYYPEVIELIKAIRPLAVHIHILSHTRRDTSMSESTIIPSQRYGPVLNAHADFTPEGAASVLEEYLQSHPEYKERDFEMLNVWRVTRGPTPKWPLALCDYQSLKIPDDIEKADVVHRTYVGEQILMYWNRNHLWYFLDTQNVENIIVFRQTDSHGIHVPFAAHASFENQPSEGAARSSIEVRLACFY